MRDSGRAKCFVASTVDSSFDHALNGSVHLSIHNLREGTVEERAQELLYVLHEQGSLDAEVIIRVLQAIASTERAEAMKHDDYDRMCRGLADAITGEMPKPRELDQQKLTLLYDLCVEILSIPQTWNTTTEEGQIRFSKEQVEELLRFIQDRLGLNNEKNDAMDLIFTLRVACEGLWRVNIDHEIQGYLQQMADQVQKHGSYNYDCGYETGGKIVTKTISNG